MNGKRVKAILRDLGMYAVGTIEESEELAVRVRGTAA